MEKSKMITIKHHSATLIVKPEHAQATHDLLAIIDKTKGKRGVKLTRPKGIDKHDSRKRAFPQFNPACMLTSDYVTAYAALNHARLHLAPLKIEPTVNRTPPELDPTVPEVVMEVDVCGQ
jgi:hypothetical protein